MPQIYRATDLPLRERLRAQLGRRGTGLIVALALEALLILLLFTIGIARAPEQPQGERLATFDAREASAPEQAAPEPQDPAQPDPADPRPAEPAPPSPALPVPSLPPPALVIPERAQPAPPAPAPSPPRVRAVIRQDRTYGPVDSGPPGPPDTQVVGTAPDGSPLYAAAWYREPYHEELAGYLSTAQGPGWGLIACRTAPDWRVEDCEILGEYPRGSGIANAARAAAWQFQVRPPRLGGKYQVGEWVRIRIDYRVSGN